MSKLYFTSDLHLGHSNIIKYCNRPFLTDYDTQQLEKNPNWSPSREAVARMDNVILDGINQTVMPSDDLWILGDFAFAPKDKYLEICRQYRNRINCRHINFIFGNHDRREIGSLFNTTYDMYELKVDGTMFVLCHYAMAVWNKSHRGSVCLYGHSHANAEVNLDKILPDRRSMDVGIDNAYRISGQYVPFSHDEIMKIMSKRKGHTVDHHSGRHQTENE